MKQHYHGGCRDSKKDTGGNNEKTLTILLVLTLLLSILAGCSTQTKDPTTQTKDPTQNSEADAFRDLPEAKYLTPATDFAGGTGTADDPYQISTAAELALLHEKLLVESEELKNDYTNAYYILTADIAVNDAANSDTWAISAPEYSWQPIGFGSANFGGVLDGNGHTVTGLYINTNSGTADDFNRGNYGLFDTVKGTVKNLNIDHSYFAVSGNSCNLGAVAGLLMDEAVIENCSVNANIDNYKATCGGVVGNGYGGADANGEVRYSRITGCSFSGTIKQILSDTAVHIGGIIGSSDGDVAACTNTGSIHFTSANVDSVGGIVGLVSEGTVSDCKNSGDLYCEVLGDSRLAIAGGIVGKVFVSATGSEKYMSRGATIIACENSGSVAGQVYAGGIVGQISNDRNDYCVTISKCINAGTVDAQKYTGGIVGHLDCKGDNPDSESVAIEGCENRADLTSDTVGGIIASFMSESGDVRIKDCSNTGNLTALGQNCAGIIADWTMNSKPADSMILIDSCDNNGNLNTALNAGGIVSFMDMPVSLKVGEDVSIVITNCLSSGSITTSTVNGYIGGILGNWGMANIATIIDSCMSNAPLSISAAADSMTEEEAEIMTVSRIAGGIIGRVGPGLLLTTDSDVADSKNVQSADAVLKIRACKSNCTLDVVNEDAEFYKNWFGGIIGNTCAEDGFSILVEDCTYTNFDRGLGNEDLPDVGTKN